MIIVGNDKIIEIFYYADNFTKVFERYSKINGLIGRKPTREPQLTYSEIMTITIVYHLSGMKNFEYYYRQIVLKSMKTYFPQAPSYERFISLLPRICVLLMIFVHRNNARNMGYYYIDSKAIKVCHNKRIFFNKVFKGMAERGKTSVGWFYGLKLFLIVNPFGEIIKVALTKGNVADNDSNLLKLLFKNLKGKIFGDKGFISKLKDEFFENGLQVITKLRANMKNKLMLLEDKILLKKRGMIESIFDILTTICDIEHTRHRSPQNAVTHLLAGLCAYNFLDRKPSAFNSNLLISNP